MTEQELCQECSQPATVEFNGAKFCAGCWTKWHRHGDGWCNDEECRNEPEA